jgi:glyoxylase-like metal-dependent hydrolase (beta-lactamase superfamily II)
MLATLFMEKDMMAIPYSPIAVNTGSKLVVIDTGTGEANFERSKGAAGQFHGNLAASGIDRNAVDTVVISHFHADHINGLLTADNKPGFPNAEILVPAAEWKYFMDDGEMGRQTTDRMKGVFSNARRVFDALGRKVTPYEPGKEIVPGITSHRSRPTATRRAIIRTSSPRARARSMSRPTSPTCRSCSRAIPAGT